MESLASLTSMAPSVEAATALQHTAPWRWNGRSEKAKVTIYVAKRSELQHEHTELLHLVK